MSSPGYLSPHRTSEDTFEYVCEFTGAGAADLTRVRSRGVTAARSGVGVHTLTIPNAGGGFAGVTGMVHTAAGVAPLVVKYSPATLAGDGTGGQTVDIEFWDLATPGLADAPSGSKVILRVAYFVTAAVP